MQTALAPTKVSTIPRWLRDFCASLKPIGRGLSAGVVTMTPDIASKILSECNSKNRSLRENVVTRYSRDIHDNCWRLNGEPVILDSDGRLLDGQHRLSAIVVADRMVDIVLLSGVQSDLMDSLDQGVVRTTGDVLGISGEVNTLQLAAAASWIWRYENRKLNNSSARPTRAEALAIIERHPQLRRSVSIAGTLVKGISGGLSVHAFLHCIFSEISSDDADLFYKSLGEGVGLSSTSPILALRNRLADRTNRFTPFEYVDLTIRAWNFYRNRMPCSKLALSRNGCFSDPE